MLRFFMLKRHVHYFYVNEAKAYLSATASKPTNRKPSSLLLEECSGFHFQTKWHCSNCNYQEGLPYAINKIGDNT